MNTKDKIKKWGKRLSCRDSKILYNRLCERATFEFMPERWQEILEQLAIGVKFREIAKDRGTSMQSIQGQRVKAINFLGYPLYQNGMTIRELFKILTK